MADSYVFNDHEFLFNKEERNLEVWTLTNGQEGELFKTYYFGPGESELQIRWVGDTLEIDELPQTLEIESFELEKVGEFVFQQDGGILTIDIRDSFGVTIISLTSNPSAPESHLRFHAGWNDHLRINIFEN